MADDEVRDVEPQAEIQTEPAVTNSDVGQSTVPAETPAATPDPDLDPKNWTYAAYKDERTKRQEAEKRIAAAEQRAAQAERQWQENSRQQPAKEPVDFYSDPDAAVQSRVAPIMDEIGRLKGNLLEERLFRIAGGKEKFEQINAEVAKAVAAGDPDVATLQRALQSKGPAAAEFVVEWFDKRTFDPAAEREKIRAELAASSVDTPATPVVTPRTQTKAPTPLSTVKGGAAATVDIHDLAKSDDVTAYAAARRKAGA